MMPIPLDVAFRHIEPSVRVQAEVRDQVNRLEQFYDRITGCQVMIEASGRNQHSGLRYRVRIHIAVPRRVLTVDRQHQDSDSHRDASGAIRDAFRTARRQVKDFANEIRGDKRARHVTVFDSATPVSEPVASRL